MTTTDHLQAFLQSMEAGDITLAVTHLAERVQLRSPILPEPIEGRDGVGHVLDALINTVDSFEPRLLLRDGPDVVAMVKITFGNHQIDAFGHIHLDSAGLIGGMTVAWRPLPAVVAVQQVLVPKLGGQALKLVPLSLTEWRYMSRALSAHLRTIINRKTIMTTGKLPNVDHPIGVEPALKKVTVRLGDTILAKSNNALILREANLPPVIYIPREDVVMDELRASDTNTYCPYKGHASYFSSRDGAAKDVAWSYEDPYSHMSMIKDHLAFYPDHVDAIETAPLH